MSGGAVIIIIDPQRVRSNTSKQATIDQLRAAADELESGSLRFNERDISANVKDEDED